MRQWVWGWREQSGGHKAVMVPEFHLKCWPDRQWSRERRVLVSSSCALFHQRMQKAKYFCPVSQRTCTGWASVTLTQISPGVSDKSTKCPWGTGDREEGMMDNIHIMLLEAEFAINASLSLGCIWNVVVGSLFSDGAFSHTQGQVIISKCGKSQQQDTRIGVCLGCLRVVFKKGTTFTGKSD